MDASGTLHLSFGAFDRAKGGPIVVYVRSAPEGWHITELNRPEEGETGIHPAGSLYTRLAFGERGEVWLGFVAGARDLSEAPGMRTPDANSVFVTRSKDGGMTWEKPILVSRSGRNQATELQIAVTGQDTLHLVWGKNLRGSHAPQVVWHAVSADGGATWSDPGEIGGAYELPFGPLNPRFFRRGPGYPLHLAFRARSQGTGTDESRIYYTWWNGTAWAPPQPLRPERSVVGFDVEVGADGGLHLLWENRPADATGALQPGGGIISYVASAGRRADVPKGSCGPPWSGAKTLGLPRSALSAAGSGYHSAIQLPPTPGNCRDAECSTRVDPDQPGYTERCHRGLPA